MADTETPVVDAPVPDETTDATPAPEPTPEPTPDIGAWRKELPDEIRDAKALEGINDIGKLAQSFVETKKLVGANTVKVPAKTDEPEVFDKFYADLGKPEKPDGYTLPTEGLAEGFKPTDEGTALFRELAHGSDLIPSQAGKLYRNWTTYEQKVKNELAQRAAELDANNTETVQNYFGDALETRLNLSKRLIDQFDDEGGLAELLNQKMADGSTLGKQPAINKFLAAVAVQYEQDELLGAGQAAPVGTTPSDAAAEIAQLEQDKDFMDRYLVKKDPVAVKRMERLFKIKNAGK